MQREQLDNKEEKKLYDDIRVGGLVEQLVEHQGWQEIVKPVLIDKVIGDMMCRKSGDLWISGDIIKKKKEETKEYTLGYAHALMDFSNRLVYMIKGASKAQKRLDEIEKKKKDNTAFKTSRY